LVQAGVQAFARVCSYDRAGAAWSELGPRPRTMAQVTYELHAVVAAAAVAGPTFWSAIRALFDREP
jgi:hypothetical protein